MLIDDGTAVVVLTNQMAVGAASIIADLAAPVVLNTPLSAPEQQAIDLYNQVAAKPTETDSFGMAKLALAALYDSTGHADAAKKIYAELKDKDAKGAAGQIASEKLTDAVQVQ